MEDPIGEAGEVLAGDKQSRSFPEAPSSLASSKSAAFLGHMVSLT